VKQRVKTLLLSQGSSEDLSSFNDRVNQELAQLGDGVKTVSMAANVHESMIAGRVAVPRLLHSLLITYEDGQP
jgi:hypothetical protein